MCGLELLFFKEIHQISITETFPEAAFLNSYCEIFSEIPLSSYALLRFSSVHTKSFKSYSYTGNDLGFVSSQNSDQPQYLLGLISLLSRRNKVLI